MEYLRLPSRGYAERKKKRKWKRIPPFLLSFLFVLPMPHDISSIREGKVMAISGNGEAVDVRGYENLISPISILFYSCYLNHGSDSRDAIKGSSLSVFHEWAFHEICLGALRLSKSFCDWSEMDSSPIDCRLESLDALTLQGSVFSDKGHGLPGFAMKSAYAISLSLLGLFPIIAWDLIASGGWATDWT